MRHQSTIVLAIALLIAIAILLWIISIVRYSLRHSHKISSFIDHSALKAGINGLQRRAADFAIWSYILIIGSGVIVFIGVVIFLFGIRVIDFLSDDEVQLKIELANKDAAVQRSDLELSIAESELEKNEKIEYFMLFLDDCLKQINNCNINYSDKNMQKVKLREKNVKAVVNAIPKASEFDIETGVPQTIRISSTFTALLPEVLKQNAINIVDLAEAVSLLATKNDAISYSELYNTEKKRLQENVVSKATEYAQSARKKNADKVAELKYADPKRKLQVIDIRKDMKRIEAELKKLSDMKESTKISIWVQDLTLRVGAVILLIFITNITYETFRYTSKVSSFYSSRSDSLQLTSKRPKESKIDLAEVEILAKILQPPHDIDKVKSPEELIMALWKKPGS